MERAITVSRAVPTESDWCAERAGHFKIELQLQAALDAVLCCCAAASTGQRMCVFFVGTPKAYVRHYRKVMSVVK